MHITPKCHNMVFTYHSECVEGKLELRITPKCHNMVFTYHTECVDRSLELRILPKGHNMVFTYRTECVERRLELRITLNVITWCSHTIRSVWRENWSYASPLKAGLCVRQNFGKLGEWPCFGFGE